MKILIVDDEPLAVERLKFLVKDINPNYQLIEAHNGIEAVEQAIKIEPDIILMDIRMPGMDGLEAAHHLLKFDKQAAIIFTTAYDEYALQAFDAHAVDYLLKPIRKERLEKALESCSQLNKLQLEQVSLQNIALKNSDIQNKQVTYRTHISVQLPNNLFLIAIENIHSFLADNKYITVKYNKNGVLAETIIEDTLKSLEQEFQHSFIRIHRNALIQKNKIEALHKMDDGRVLLILKDFSDSYEVSRRHLAHVRKLMKS
ncbi:MAG: response regulator transcription factor [Gammaproteobacteria bacterium]|nr:response regulator transcription factor [Gammaproteobacteria bacterium]